MDVAKQGLSLAQKIKQPVASTRNVLSAPEVYAGGGKTQTMSIDDLYSPRQLVSPAERVEYTGVSALNALDLATSAPFARLRSCCAARPFVKPPVPGFCSCVPRATL